MKKWRKRIGAFAIAVLMVFGVFTGFLGTGEQVQAASVYVNPYSTNQVVTYKPGSEYSAWSSSISIMGCDSASQIKNLKSSDTSVAKVAAKDRYIQVIFGKKAGKVKISCTVKNVKLSTYFTVKKYTNPLSAYKIGSTSFVTKYAKNDRYRQSKAYKSKVLSLKAKSGWQIRSVSVYNGSTSKNYTVNASSFRKSISLTADYGTIYVYCYNSTTKVGETLTFYKSNY